METKLRKAIRDFLNCNKSNENSNIFRNDFLAHQFSRKVQARNHEKQFEKHGLVPTEFVNYLQRTEVVQNDIIWPKGRITLTQLAGLLDGCYKSRMVKNYPMLRKSFI